MNTPGISKSARAVTRLKPVASSRRAGRLVQRRFGFSWRLAIWLWKPPFLGVGKAWISLDSLVRNEIFQWVTGEFRAKKFALAFPGVESRAGRERAVGAMRKGGIVHGARLRQFLLFCKKLSYALYLAERRGAGLKLSRSWLNRSPVRGDHGPAAVGAGGKRVSTVANDGARLQNPIGTKKQ